MFSPILSVKLFWLKLRRRASVWPWSLGHGENRWPEAQPASRGVYRLQHTSTQNVKSSYKGGFKGGFKQQQIKAQELSEVRVLLLDGVISVRTWKSCITHWISHLSHSKKIQSWSRFMFDIEKFHEYDIVDCMTKWTFSNGFWPHVCNIQKKRKTNVQKES